MGFKALVTRIIVLMCLLVVFPITAEENEYLVIDNNSGEKKSFETYKEANNYYDDNIDEYDNLLLYENDRLIKMEYGVVELDSNSQYVEFYSLNQNKIDYLCPRYGIDGAYLYTDNENVYFKIANDVGYSNIKNVTLIPYEELNVKISLYHTDDQYLYHNIKTQLNYEYCSNSLKIDFIPEFLNDNSDYFSYDGHYFYDDFYLMINDYRQDSYTNSLNEIPYYNYYQYLPYRSITNYDYKVLESYFYNVLNINGSLVRYNDINNDGATDEINRSALYGVVDDFYVYQNIYGANALMLIAGAINESNYGKSYASFYNNNLYSLSAYDSFNQTNNRYTSITSSIHSYAKYFVSNRYSNHNRLDYCGSFVGDKESGINSTYTLDHYYGERLASTYFDLDNKLGLLDYNSYCIGVVDKSFNIYNDEDLDDYKYSISNDRKLSFVILEEYDNSFLIQLDDASNDEYLYDYKDCCGYISKNDISIIINNGNYNNPEYVNVTYDFNGGTFAGYSTLTIKTKKGSVPAYIEPSLDGYEFVGYGVNFETVNEDVTYVAKYKKINEISISYLFNKQNELYPTLDLSKAYLTIRYEDGANNKVNITSDMCSYIDLTQDGEQTVTVTYCGLSDEKIITIDDDISKIYETIEDCIDNKDYEKLKSNIGLVNYSIDMPTIREIDSVLRNKNNRNYVINDSNNQNDISISGLDLSLDDKSSLSFFKDTYYVLVDEIKPYAIEKIMMVAGGYGFDKVSGIDISFKFNFENIKLNGPAVVQLKIDDKVNNNIYTVYHLDSNGDIIKCRTTHSNNYVQFIIYEEGSYLVLSKKGMNTFNIDDSIENLSYENMGYDNHKFNLNVLFITVLVLISLIGIIIYYIISNKKELEWKDYRKSLQKVDTVQEEKLKN